MQIRVLRAQWTFKCLLSHQRAFDVKLAILTEQAIGNWGKNLKKSSESVFSCPLKIRFAMPREVKQIRVLRTHWTFKQVAFRHTIYD